jgi:hypothetical protein
MNQSSVVTGGVTLSAATLVPFVSWALGGFPQPIPESIPYLIAAALLTVGHAAYNMVIARQDKAAPPAAPALPAAAPAPAIASSVRPAQAGRISLPILIVAVMVAVAAVSLMTGCTSLTQAGNTAYSLEPVAIDGKTAYKFTATDGKEYSARVIKASLAEGGFTIEVTEGASTAFQGQAISGKALSILPSFAPLLLPPGPATLDVQP